MSKFDDLLKTLSEAIPVATTPGQPVTNQPAPGQPAPNQPATYNQQTPAQPVVKPTVNPANVKTMDDLVKHFNDPAAKIDSATLQTTLQNLAKAQPKV